MAFRRLLAIAALFAAVTLLSIAAEVPRRSGEFVLKYPDKNTEELLSRKLKGKNCTMIAFIRTTCPHCQTLATLLSEMKKSYGSRGFQAFVVAYDPQAAAFRARFQQLFCPDIPVSVSIREAVHPYLQLSLMGLSYVPKLVVIDGSGMIREQYSGGDSYFNPSTEKANLQKSIAKYLK